MVFVGLIAVAVGDFVRLVGWVLVWVCGLLCVFVLDLLLLIARELVILIVMID